MMRTTGVLSALDDLERECTFAPPAGRDEQMDLLAEIARESDQSLVAACTLLGLSLENVEERAGSMQYDGGTARVTANRLAVTIALHERDPEFSDRAARWIFNNAAAILEWEKANNATRRQTIQAMRECMTRQSMPNSIPEDAVSEHKEAC